jgi:hypothetical protein
MVSAQPASQKKKMNDRTQKQKKNYGMIGQNWGQQPISHDYWNNDQAIYSLKKRKSRAPRETCNKQPRGVWCTMLSSSKP